MKDNNLLFGMHAGAKPEIFRFAEKLRKEMTDSERLLWENLKLKPLGFKFRRQHPFNIYVLDFYCNKARLSIEIDGDYHLSEKQMQADKTRTGNIKQFGVKEIRFSKEEITNNLPVVLKIIEAQLEKYTLEKS